MNDLDLSAALARLRPGSIWTASVSADGQWSLDWRDDSQGRPTDAEITTEAARASLRRHAAAKRFAVETGGIAVSGLRIPTDRDTQSKLQGASALMQIVAGATVSWKIADGSFTTFDATQLQTVAVAVGMHVQAAFVAEATAIAGIDGGTITQPSQIDTLSWPTNG